MDLRPTERSYRKGERIYEIDDPAHHVYAVVHGAVRSFRYLSDGRRHLGAFHLPGEMFGLGSGPFRNLETEAVVATTMLSIKRDDLEREANRNASLAFVLCKVTSRDLQNAQDHLLLLGRKSAAERVAAFLLEMDHRLSANGDMDLPMCGRDIGDYLGLTLETVSRCLAQFQALRIICLTQHRRVTLLRRDRLRELNPS
jgi:CRP-like cAMP-binding protein